MCVHRCVIMGLVGILLVPQVVGAQVTPSEEPSASLPLEEVLRLYRENEAAKEVKEVSPPVDATVDSIDFKGRLLDQSIEFTATIAVSVLEDDEWVVVPLIRKIGNMNLVGLPDMSGGTLTVVDGDLALVARKRGTHRFNVKLTQNAQVDGAKRLASIEVADATMAVLRLSFDASSFHLRSKAANVGGEEGILFASSNRFTVEWERRGAPVLKVDTAADEVPPTEPVVTRALASVISTLEGKRILRILYEFRMQGARVLRCRLGSGQTLKRVVLNGSAVSFETEEGWLQLEAAPARSGGDSGTLELLVSGEPAAYHLAGKLEFTVPTVSWPVHELFFTVNLPEVFNYTWTSGSLEPIETSPPAPFVHAMPTPGKRLAFHQYLLSDSTPRLALAYAVDLEGRYYRP